MIGNAVIRSHSGGNFREPTHVELKSDSAQFKLKRKDDNKDNNKDRDSERAGRCPSATGRGSVTVPIRCRWGER